MGRSGRRPARNLQRQCAHLFVDETVGSEDDGTAQPVRISGEICDLATGFFDEQNSCGSIPFRKPEFPEAVEAAGGDRGEIERGGAIAAYAVRALREVAIVLKIGAGFAVSYRKTGAEEAGRKRGDLGDVNFLAIQRGAFAAGGREEFVVERIENDSGEQRGSLCKRNGNAETGIAVRIVRGAVKGINVPAEFRSRCALVPGSLFGSNSMVRKVLCQPLDDEPFRSLVRLSDEIYFVSFVANVERAR